jgi:hypothetical protein
MRPLLPAVLLALPLAALAGCGGSDSDSPGASSTVTVTSTPSDTSTSSSPSMTSPPSSPATSEAPSSSDATGDAGAALCGTPDLTVQVKAAEGGGAAGTQHQSIVFTNESDHDCEIGGWPGVSYVAGRAQLGAAADRTGERSSTVLAPGDSATSDLAVTEPGAYPDCQPANADKLKIYPPDNKRAVVMRISAPGCGNDDVHLLTIGPVTAG